jgi:hypothetical protein
MRLGVGVQGLAVAAILFAAPALVHAQQQFGAPGNTYTTWGTNTNTGRIDVTYFIGSGFSAMQVNLLRQAAATWNSAGSYVNLVEVGVAGNVNFTTSNPGSFALYTLNMGTVTPQAPSTFPDGNPWSRITGPVQVNINDLTVFGGLVTYWDGNGLLAPSAQIDFQMLALDVMGRAIGLGLSVDPSSVMQPDGSYSFSTPGNHALSSTDLAAINAVYGSPEPATLALFGIGLAVIGFSKKLRRTTLGL